MYEDIVSILKSVTVMRIPENLMDEFRVLLSCA